MIGHTIMNLDEYLTKARVPYIAALREAQNYVRAYTRGLGIFELPEYLAWPDQSEWEPLTDCRVWIVNLTAAMRSAATRLAGTGLLGTDAGVTPP